jgi:outer membrane protein TolC
VIHNLNRLLTALAVALALSQAGCAVVPQPANSLELAAFSEEIGNHAVDPIEAVPAEIDIHDAIARAVKYNAELRVKELEVTVEAAKLNVTQATLLPDVVSNSSYYSRSSSKASYSSLSPSNGSSSDLALSWNILDFGLSYVRARQGGNVTLYRAEEYRRAASKVVEETRVAFWRAVAAERLQSLLPELQSGIESALRKADAQARDSNLNPLDALNYSRDLLNEKRELNQLVSSLAGAGAVLKQLIHVPQEQPLTLKSGPDAPLNAMLSLSPPEAVQIALEHRAEVRQLLYQTRITSEEVHALVLQKLPSLGVNSGLAAGSLSVLADANWVAWGAKAAWSLMSLLRLPRDLEVLDAEKSVLHQQALAMGVTISMQAYISSTQCKLLGLVYQDAQKSLRVQQQIENQVQRATILGRNGNQPLVRERLSTLLAEIRSRLAYADLQNAYGTYQSTLGLDSVDLSQLSTLSANEIALQLRHAQDQGYSSWEPYKVVSSR